GGVWGGGGGGELKLAAPEHRRDNEIAALGPVHYVDEHPGPAGQRGHRVVDLGVSRRGHHEGAVAQIGAPKWTAPLDEAPHDGEGRQARRHGPAHPRDLRSTRAERPPLAL